MNPYKETVEIIGAITALIGAITALLALILPHLKKTIALARTVTKKGKNTVLVIACGMIVGGLLVRFYQRPKTPPESIEVVIPTGKTQVWDMRQLYLKIDPNGRPDDDFGDFIARLKGRYQLRITTATNGNPMLVCDYYVDLGSVNPADGKYDNTYLGTGENLISLLSEPVKTYDVGNRIDFLGGEPVLSEVNKDFYAGPTPSIAHPCLSGPVARWNVRKVGGEWKASVELREVKVKVTRPRQ